MEACRKDEKQAHIERAKKEGKYRRGMNMDEDGVDGYSEEDFQQRPQKKRKADTVLCKHCGKTGHSTTRSRQCLLYKGTAAVATEVIMEQVPSAGDDANIELLQIDAAADTLHMDGCELLPSDDEDEFPEFHDAATWSEDEDEPGPTRGLTHGNL
jgi:hypothetical protein